MTKVAAELKITERIDAITRIVPERRQRIAPIPKSVKIELTARCDLKCFFCAQHMKLRDRRDMSWELLTKLLKQMREAGVEEIGLFYLGESMLYPRLVDAVHYAKHDCKYPYVFLTTNGVAARPEKVEAIVRAGLDSLKFSMNAADQDQFLEVTGVDAFQKMIQHLKSARAVVDKVAAETGHRCGLYASSILFDGEQKRVMEKTVEEIKPFVDEHYYLPLYNQAGLTQGVRDTKPVPGNIGRVGALRDPIPCWAVFTEGHITYDGYLSACCFDHDGRFHMGDLKEMSFVEAWNSPKFQALRQVHLDGNVTGSVCESCVVCS